MPREPSGWKPASRRGGASLLSLLVLLAAGCDRQPSRYPEPAAKPLATSPLSPPSETLEQAEARFDATVWRDEVLARRHEATFVNLRDTLRRATNKVAVLAGFDFDEISVPVPQGGPEALDLGVRRQRFNDSDRRTLPRRAWAETLTQLHASGWRIQQGEWNHERFVPPATNRPATSQFSFHLHGERPPAMRFIVEGTLGVEWGPMVSPDSLIRAHRLVVSNFTVLERSGPPGFARTAVVTPEPPERHGEMVNMHPLIVTDIDGNGTEDILMTGVNKLFVNDGTAKFTPMEFITESVFRGSADAGVVADFNGDGKLDFLTMAKQGVLANKLVLYPGNSAVPFTLEPAFAWDAERIAAPSVMTAGDIDHDGDLDVWIAQYKPPYIGGQLPTPYYDANDGHPSFSLLTDGQWLGGPHTGLNRLHIHLNQLQTGNHWIGVKLASTTPGSSPIGAKVWAKTDDRTYVAQIVTGDSYQSQHPSSVHFGLGKTRRVKELTVRWPNGKTRTLTDPLTDRYHHLAP